MPSPAASTDPRSRDRLLARVRRTGRILVAGAVGGTAALSAVAAHAFKGHSGKPAAAPVAVPARTQAPAATPRAARVAVPPPQQVPAIDGVPAQLQPPPQPPAAEAAVPADVAPPVDVAPPQTSGGS